MKPSEVQGYFAEKLESLGLREAADPFGRNIPADVGDLTYTFEPGQSTVTTTNQLLSRFTMPVLLSIYFIDYRTQTDLRNVAFTKMEQIFGLMLSAERSLGAGGFSIQPSGVSIDPLSDRNLACAVMRLELDVSMYLQFRGI